MPRPKNPPDRVNPWRLFVGAMVPNWLLERPELSLGAKVCYGRLAQYAGRKGYAYPKMRTLGNALGVTDRQARTYVSELRKHGLLDVVCFKSQGRPNRFYFLNHPWMYEDEVPETTPESEGSHEPDEMESEFGNDSGEVAGPPEESFRYHRKDTSGGTGRILPDIEESQGRESEEVNQSGAERHLGSKLHSSGLSSPGAGSTKTSRDLCAQGLSSGDVPEQPTIDDLKAAEAEAKAKATVAKARKKRAGRRVWESSQKEQRIQNLNGKKLTKLQRQQLGACERVWLGGMRKSWPDTTFGSWDGKQRGQCKQLLEKYPGELVEQAISYVISQWDSIRDRIFKGKGTFPSVGMLLRMHEVLVPESQKFSKALALHQEYEAWFDAHPHKLVAPQELESRYEAVKPDLKALGILD